MYNNLFNNTDILKICIITRSIYNKENKTESLNDLP